MTKKISNLPSYALDPDQKQMIVEASLREAAVMKLHKQTHEYVLAELNAVGAAQQRFWIAAAKKFGFDLGAHPYRYNGHTGVIEPVPSDD